MLAFITLSHFEIRNNNMYIYIINEKSLSRFLVDEKQIIALIKCTKKERKLREREKKRMKTRSATYFRP